MHGSYPGPFKISIKLYMLQCHDIVLQTLSTGTSMYFCYRDMSFYQEIVACHADPALEPRYHKQIGEIFPLITAGTSKSVNDKISVSNAG